MKNRIFNSMVSFVLICCIMLTGLASFGAEAITEDDIEKLEMELQDIKKRQEETEAALAEIEKNEHYVESSIAYAEELVKGYTEYVVLLSKIIEEYDVAIAQTEENILELTEDYEQIYKTYLSRLRIARETDFYSVLELVFKADSLTDLLESAERVADALDYDKRVINKLENQKTELLLELEREENLKKDQQAQIDGYEALKVSVSERVNDLIAQLMELRDDKAEAEDQMTLDEILEQEADKALEELIEEYIRQQETTAEYARGEEMIWPLYKKWNYVSSKFGYRLHPVLGYWKGHKGIDIPANGGDPIYAALSGKVITSVYSTSYGYYVIIDHGEFGTTGKRLYTVYAHASKLFVKKGDVVKQGDIIAKVGKTGISTGNHLHFEVRLGSSNPVDPLDYVSRPTK